MWFYECYVKKDVDGRPALMLAQLPERYAHKGRFVSIRSPDTKEWSNGWQVVAVGPKKTAEEVKDLPETKVLPPNTIVPR